MQTTVIGQITTLQLREPEPHMFYSIEAAASLSRIPRRMIAVYCQRGLVSPVMDPNAGGWFFNDDGIRRLRHIEYLREVYGMNLSAVGMFLGLWDEVEDLRREVRFLRQH